MISDQSISFTQGIRIARIATEDDPVYLQDSLNNNNHSPHQPEKQPVNKSYQSMNHSANPLAMLNAGKISSGTSRKDQVPGSGSPAGELIEMQSPHSSSSGQQQQQNSTQTQRDQVISACMPSSPTSSSSSSNGSASASFSSCLDASMEDSAIDAVMTTDSQSGSPNPGHRNKCRCHSYALSTASTVPSTIIPEIKLIEDNGGHGLGETAVRVRKVNLSYREKIINSLTASSATQPVFVLNGISMTVPRAAIYGLLGPSGCGKTSLLRCM